MTSHLVNFLKKEEATPNFGIQLYSDPFFAQFKKAPENCNTSKYIFDSSPSCNVCMLLTLVLLHLLHYENWLLFCAIYYCKQNKFGFSSVQQSKQTLLRFKLNFFLFSDICFYQVLSAENETSLSSQGEQFSNDNDLCILPDNLQPGKLQVYGGVTWFVLAIWIIKFQYKHIWWGLKGESWKRLFC